MKIRINDRPDIQEIEVIINCVADDPLVNKIISALNTVDAKLLCRRQGETFQLGLADILYIESVDRKTFLYTEEQVYETDRRDRKSTRLNSSHPSRSRMPSSA